MRILDLTAGSRAVWADKTHRDAIYVDIREHVRPTVVADSRHLPFPNSVFDLIVFDPPHVNGGKNSHIARDYGHHTTAEIRDFISASGREAVRVSRPGALMAFKWNDHDQPFDKVLDLLRPWWHPLFGHTTSIRKKHVCQTAWIMLRRV